MNVHFKKLLFVFSCHFNRIIIFFFIPSLYTFGNAKIVYVEWIMKQRCRLLLQVAVSPLIFFYK